MASPEPGRPMTAKVERVGGCVRRLARRIADAVAVDAGTLVRALGPRLDGLGFRLDPRGVRHRAAWWLAGQWLTGYAVGALPAGATLEEAEDWFYGAGGAGLPRLAPPDSMEEVGRLASREEVWALLPYLLDPLAPGTRRHLLASDVQAADRAARKERGVFFTPADVAGWMAARAARAAPPGRAARTWLDPACGSGVFLRAALGQGAGAALVFGVDVEPVAAEMAAFVVLVSMSGPWESSPWCAWQRARSRLATLDALTLEAGTGLRALEQRARSRRVADLDLRLRDGEVPEPAPGGPAHTALATLFPELDGGAHVLVCNPPYAALGSDPARRSAAGRFASFADGPPSPAGNIHTPFVELGWRLTRPATGSASIVVPLSIAFSQARQYRAVRQAMQAREGRWECAFFDRAPDALFGDDVKTRNAVLTYSAASAGMAVTGVLRWTSRSRASFLGGIAPVDVDVAIDRGIPRVSTPAEATLLRALRSRAGCLAHDVVRSATVPATAEMAAAWPDTVFVGPTAYNRLNCHRDLRPCVDAGHDASGALHALRFADARTADAAYALLASRVTCWLWRVEGDAFHVGRSFLTRLPVTLGRLSPDALDGLGDLGRRLWERSAARPVVAVNRGRRTVAYPATRDEGLLAGVDRAVADALGLAAEIAAVDLPGWHRTLVVVDHRDARRRRIPPLRGVAC